MSSPDSFGQGGPFGEIMRNLARLFATQGPLNWEVARQLAQWTATGGETEANPDPSSRVRLEELIRVAELHVSEATGISVAPSGVLSVRAVTPGDWAIRSLEAWKPLLERLAGRMSSSMEAAEGGLGPVGLDLEGFAGGDAPGQESNPLASMFSNLPQLLAPFLLGMHAGVMIGQLATGAMGQYDLPMPRPPGDELLMVTAAIDRFAADWSLDADEVRLWICLREATNHAVLGRPHVRRRVDDLVDAYVDAFAPDPSALEERLSSFDPTDAAAMGQMFSDPETLLGELQNHDQRRIQIPLRALLSAVTGYVDFMMDGIGRRLIPSYGPLTEALRRRRLEEGPGKRVLGQLFGISLDAASYEQGSSFVTGIMERAGSEGLSRLWRSERELPTPAEITAPGLWLARIELEDDPP